MNGTVELHFCMNKSSCEDQLIVSVFFENEQTARGSLDGAIYNMTCMYGLLNIMFWK